MRERWFGNTGRRVPELALEGTLGSRKRWCWTASDEAACAGACQSRPVVVRAVTGAVKAAPGLVASVLVHRGLLALD